MSTFTHPIIVPSNYDVEDAFSSTDTPDYTPTSPDYFPASPGNTSFDPLEDLSKDLLASLTISPFYDDPYMKVMQAYNATNNESPIPPLRALIAPPTVLPPSLVLPPSPLFDPRDFFLPGEILPPQKQARFLSLLIPLPHLRVLEYTRLKKHCMDYIKLLELGMKPCQHICWIMGFKEGKLTRPYSSKGTKVIFYLSNFMWMISSLVQQISSYAMHLSSCDMWKFQMSSMGELTFFLGLQVKQSIFISQDKYVVEILKKFGFIEVKTASTPMETQKPLLKDEDGEEVDVHMYRSMIGSLMYLTSSRPDIMFAVCACARYQVNPKVSHLYVVKRIFSDYDGASLDRKSTTGELGLWAFLLKDVFMSVRDMFSGGRMIIDGLWKNAVAWCLSSKTNAWNEFSSTMASAIIYLATNQKFNFSKFIFESMIRNLENVSGKFVMYPRKPKRKDTQVPQSSDPMENVVDEVVHKELGDSLVRAATTASSLEAEHDSGSIIKTRSKATPNESISQGTNSGDEDITLVSVHDVDVSASEEVFVAKQEVADEMEVVKDGGVVVAGDKVSTASAATTVSTATTTTATTIDDITLAKVLEGMKSTKPKQKRVVIQELGESTATKLITTYSSQQSQGQGKGILVRPVKLMKQRLMLIINWLKDCKHKNKKSCLLKKRLTLINNLLEKEESILPLKEQKRKRKQTTNKSSTEKDNVVGGGQRKESRNRAGIREYEEAKGASDKETSELKRVMEIIKYEKK
ncbi:hypothetical protein Tco_0877058 [Tanacetum coccineum]|uniref:Reverse transcriptase Ty1/copia-type domain-containing protein n=1 Tax=Tanacetum coccineum TaxID=301880 RepID=A0ABQ5BWN9_9ASTR